MIALVGIANANLRNENQNLTSENQEVVRQIEDNRRNSENKSKAMKQYISDLSKVQEQQEQNVNMLSDRIAKLYNKEQKLKAVVSRFENNKN